MLLKLYIKLVGIWLNILAIFRPSYAAKKGFDLFCTPFKIKLSERQKEFMRTAELSTMSSESLPDIQVYKWGNGSKRVLLVHGWQSHSFRWIKYILKLKELNYTVYAFDAPASGYSKGKILNVPHYGEVLDEFLKQYGDFNYAVGHSLGAFMLFYYLKDYNKKAFEKLVSIACPGEATDFVDIYVDALGINNRTKNLITKEFMKRYKAPSYYSLDNFTKNIEIPGLYIHDKQDKEVPFSYTKVLEKNWPSAEKMYTDGLGHKMRSPDVVSRVIDFLAKE
jgi:pimeloyl-ACP methyl ester carboxylesterase